MCELPVRWTDDTSGSKVQIGRLARQYIKAMQVLKSRLFDLERQKADQERAQARKSQVGSGDRSQKIRTYNFPQGRVTDHRINLSLYNIQAVIDGGLDELLDALIAEDQANRLLEWENA